MKKILHLVARLVTIVCAAVLARWALRQWVDGPEPASADEAWARTSGPAPQRSEPAPKRSPVTLERTVASAPAPPSSNGGRPGGSPSGREWVRPGPAGEVPPTHPVKAKLGSRTYRIPGGRGYDASRPDRCYRSAEAAEADGFTMAKR